jgi:hypothetical protein
MKRLVWISLVMIWITGCAVPGDALPSEQLGTAEQDVLSLALWCQMPGDRTWHAPGCRVHVANATNGTSLLAKHTGFVNPLRYFWHIPGVQIVSGCGENDGFCNLQFGNACTDRNFAISVDSVDTVTGELVRASIVLHFPAVCFTFGQAVFC